ncbi:type VI secretion system tip protein VgrG [Methylomarinum sp. Ch1-1]|uniref:Type VI secretion system tip protein VgrG n=1 Tax=Methylomarinum roseum TaxID=3067653 RepID=A0AAU7NSG9_9GAMM|nr:type VI secretion system tip protein VgrG [Methylomarinum sp. Ch1-1]MDP4520097.1 type VI secretion system tip protein VgrG [Methylomarinum sp. Ch1-1]
MNRTVRVITPLPENELIFVSMNGREEMGRLFEFEVDLLRDLEQGNVAVNELLGKGMTIELDLSAGERRYFHGEIVSFKHTGLRNRYSCYRALLRPYLWNLTLNADCRIFQDKSIKEVIKAVLATYGYVDFEDKLNGTYPTLDYCVQYRESDFDFISRLMEQAGIFYYFKHDSGKHTLVLTDSNNNFQTVTGYSTIPYYPPENKEARGRDHIHQWLQENQITTGQYELNDFDFESPNSDLTARSKNIGSYTNSDQEIYDPPGKYTVVSEGTQITNTRLEEQQMAYSRKRGQGNAVGLAPGMKFTLENHYFAEENIEHVIVAASYIVQGDDPAAAMGGSGEIFQCSFSAIDINQAYRSASLTPKPVIAGSQTAIVVGKEGEEIWTDQYGRVKVQFHWDREGENNENSSCWARVSQPMAGKNWGWISLPRIGQEVIVSFLEGDPDRPLITGRVYNDEQMPPYELPANQTQSGIKTRSTKQGAADNFNEIRFEDKIGEEELYIHAEKDCNRVVENDDTLKIGFDKMDPGDQTVDIYNHRTVTLDQGNDTLTVKMGDHSIDVGAGKSTITAATSIELKVGSNSIKIDQSGITIKGMMVKIEGTTSAEMKSSMTTVKGDGMLTLKGGVIMIN